MSLETRLLTEHDAAAYWHLRLEALECEPESFGEAAEEHRRTSVESAAERLAADPTDNFVVGAFQDGELVGMAGFYRLHGVKAHHRGRIWGVYLRASHRRQGLGRAILVALLAQIKACPGIEQISLTVIVGQDAARALYRSLGFVTFGVEACGLKVGGHYLDNEHMLLRFQG